MFEQPLYEYEPVAAPLKEGDLFHNYEIKGWTAMPGLFKVVGLSAVVNVVALLVVAQTSLLTMKGCDSPLVGSVCQVLDTVYVGAMLFGTDREFVDVAYEKTELGPDDEITFIDASKIEPPLYYPADYFQIANPEQFKIPQEIAEGGNPFIYSNPGFNNQGFQGEYHGFPPGINPPSSGNDLFNTPQHLPQPNGDVIDENDLPKPGKTPSWGPSYVPKSVKTPRVKKNQNNIPGIDPNIIAEEHSPSPSASSTPTVQPSVEATAPVEAINTRPFKDVMVGVLQKLEQKQLDLQAPFRIGATAKLAKDGKIAKGSFRVVGTEGDQHMGMVTADLLGAFNDSNLLYYLKDLNGRDLKFVVEQDQANVRAAISSEAESDTRAQSMLTVLNFPLGLAIGEKQKKIQALESENNPANAAELQKLHEDLALLQSIKVTANGKELLIAFSSQKPIVHQWIQSKLAEQRAEPKPTDATGNVPKTPDPAVK